MTRTHQKGTARGTQALALGLLVLMLIAALSLSGAATRPAAAAATTSSEAFSWGSNFHGKLGNGTTTDRNTPGAVKNLTNVRNIDAGSGFTLAVTE